ncbi:MAG: DUF1848 domain-containing protein [Bacilli bacterium]
MILNVSGRTDIVAFYSDWFIKRYREGFVDVRNPFYNKQVSRIYFSDVDCILFCTKNPIPIVKYLKDIDKPIVFHVTLTPYKKDIEPNVPPKGLVIEAIKKISSIIGSDNIYIRYDPILINDRYTIDYHIKAFNNMCCLLNGYVKHIIVSFIDDYKNVRNNKKFLKYKNLTLEDYEKIGVNFSNSAKDNGMTVQTCCEKNDLVSYGFIKGECMSFNYAYKLTGKTDLKRWKERDCNCVSMVDIGVYNSCRHFCKYCYANYDEKIVNSNYSLHNLDSSLLIGELSSDDIIKRRSK